MYKFSFTKAKNPQADSNKKSLAAYTARDESIRGTTLIPVHTGSSLHLTRVTRFELRKNSSYELLRCEIHELFELKGISRRRFPLSVRKQATTVHHLCIYPLYNNDLNGKCQGLYRFFMVQFL